MGHDYNADTLPVEKLHQGFQMEFPSPYISKLPQYLPLQQFLLSYHWNSIYQFLTSAYLYFFLLLLYLQQEHYFPNGTRPHMSYNQCKKLSLWINSKSDPSRDHVLAKDLFGQELIFQDEYRTEVVYYQTLDFLNTHLKLFL